MRHHALLPLAMLALSTPAFAQERPQSNCGKFEEARAGLAKEFGEVPTYAGMLGEGENALIIFTSEKRTFTVFVLRPDGIACTVAAGEEFHQLPPMAPPKPQAPETGL